MIRDLQELKAKIAADREAFNDHLSHAPPQVLQLQADGLAAYAARLDEWDAYFDKWVPRKDELDRAYQGVPDLVAEWLTDTFILMGVPERDANG